MPPTTGRSRTHTALAISILIVGATAGAQSSTERRTPEPGYREVGASITGASEVRAASVQATSKLAFQSSDERLASGFEWAKRQALAFVFEDDPVGPWYEAAEPGREAFCMRDVAHQAMGAHALGLARQNRNMLPRFAEAVSDARDWCSFWEIDRHNRPAPVDYKNDAEFWYNLPASFGVLDCCFRMYVWTGDPAYVEDPVFLDFYDRTTHDYVERWGLGLDQIMKRPRLLNVRGMPDPKRKFQLNRGIPGYDEQDKEYVLGTFSPRSTPPTRPMPASRRFAGIWRERGPPSRRPRTSRLSSIPPGGTRAASTSTRA